MIKINFFGDFKVNNPDKVVLSDDLLKELASSSLNIINFEAPIYREGQKPIAKSGPNIFQNKESAKFLEENGFNVISLANNHLMDYGEDGLKSTLNSFKKAHTIGAGDWEKAYTPYIYEINGIKIAILSLTQREFGALDDNKQCYGTAWMLHHSIDNIISSTKQKVNFVFIYVHAGIEDEFYPLPELRSLYKHFIDMGADGVIASHPHTPQGWEKYKDKMIFYSLGNFCFQTKDYSNKYWNNSLLVSFEIINNKLDYKITYIYYDILTSVIEIAKQENFNKHIEKINSVLADNDKYISEVNLYCNRLSKFYIWTMQSTGLFRSSIKIHLKGIINIIFKRKYHTTNIHLLNTLRCEVHNWCFTRYLNNQITNINKTE